MQPEGYIEAVQQRIRAPLTSQEIAMVMYLGGAGFTVAECTQIIKDLLLGKQMEHVAEILGHSLSIAERARIQRWLSNGVAPDVAVQMLLRTAVPSPVASLAQRVLAHFGRNR